MSNQRVLTGLVGWVAVSFAAAAVAALFPPALWYAELAKPTWAPAGALIGPVWMVLYLMMGIAAWLVWRSAGWTPALIAFDVQLGLNAAWPWLLFGLHRPGLALAGIVLLWVALLATVLAFRPLSKAAAVLLLPALAWVSFVAVLNVELWRRNPLL
jgi:tryptophan-rich sensory protein